MPNQAITSKEVAEFWFSLTKEDHVSTRTKELIRGIMNKYVYPVIGEKKIREILSADIMLLMRFVPNAPEDFLAELDRNEPARNRFYALSQKEQQHIIGQAQSVKDIYEMRTLVDSIRA